MDKLKSYNELLRDALGYVWMDRSFVNDPIWTAEKFTAGQAWMDLVLLAAPEDCRYRRMFGDGDKFEMGLKKGQLVATYGELARRWRWSIRKVYNFLMFLEDEEIISRTIGLFEGVEDVEAEDESVITILGYAYRPED